MIAGPCDNNLEFAKYLAAPTYVGKIDHVLLINLEPLLPDIEESVRQEELADWSWSKRVWDRIRCIRWGEERSWQPEDALC